MRYKKYNYSKVKIFLKITILIIMLLISTIVIDKQIRPIIEQTAKYHTQIIATKIINRTISDTAADIKSQIGEFTTFTKDDNGNVIAVSANSANINHTTSILIDSIVKNLDAIKDEHIDLHIGTLSGINFLSGRGPKLKFKLAPMGNVKSEITSEFESCGINQSIHRIVLNLDVTVNAFIPGYSIGCDVDYNYILSETVIVGNIPQSYTNVYADTMDTAIDDMNDYGAEQYIK
ncbi:MAG: sporulation protein YunB [Oscillospiraceae bacterium]|nr:sporulation protein YunB [Oscillospiraceae bacterium]